jgi:DNA-binding XRE family transcriptional regulator
VRPANCAKCGGGEDKLHAHHTHGYEPDHWLAVLWLCPPCHVGEHVQISVAKRIAFRYIPSVISTSQPEMDGKLKRLRERKGLTQVELAAKARITQPYLAQLESGVRLNPSLDVLKRLAEALGVAVRDLL